MNKLEFVILMLCVINVAVMYAYMIERKDRKKLEKKYQKLWGQWVDSIYDHAEFKENLRRKQ